MPNDNPMNYMAEIKLFYDWLETHNLPPASIALWHGLMFIANRSGWKTPLSIPLSVIEARTKISKTSIYRERERLQEAGLIDFSTKGGKASCLYIINSLSPHFASQYGKQNVVNEESEAQINHQTQHLESQIGTHYGNIYKLNYTESDKENIKESLSEMDVGAEVPPCLSPEKREKEKSCGKKEKEKKVPNLDTEAILQTIEPPWLEMMRTWLEYKRLRKESYKSKLGIRKCLTMLRNLSGNNLQTATAIIDQSIANNWAGLFELKRSAYTSRGQAAPGQHIGQIKQPETEEQKNRILEKFMRKRE